MEPQAFATNTSVKWDLQRILKKELQKVPYVLKNPSGPMKHSFIY